MLLIVVWRSIVSKASSEDAVRIGKSYEDKAEDNVHKEDAALFNKSELSDLLDEDEEDEE